MLRCLPASLQDVLKFRATLRAGHPAPKSLQPPRASPGSLCCRPSWTRSSDTPTGCLLERGGTESFAMGEMQKDPRIFAERCQPSRDAARCFQGRVYLSLRSQMETPALPSPPHGSPSPSLTAGLAPTTAGISEQEEGVFLTPSKPARPCEPGELRQCPPRVGRVLPLAHLVLPARRVLSARRCAWGTLPG